MTGISVLFSLFGGFVRFVKFSLLVPARVVNLDSARLARLILRFPFSSSPPSVSHFIVFSPLFLTLLSPLRPPSLLRLVSLFLVDA